MECLRGKRVDGDFDGTVPQILGLVCLDLKVMVASSDSNPEILALMYEKLLVHV